MDKRNEELNFIVGTIDNLCRAYGIELIPYELKSGQYVMAIHDIKEDKYHVIIKDRED